MNQNMKEDKTQEPPHVEAEETVIAPDMIEQDFVKEHIATDPRLRDLGPIQAEVFRESFFELLNKGVQAKTPAPMEEEAEEEKELIEEDVEKALNPESMTLVVNKKSVQKQRRKARIFGGALAMANVAASGPRKEPEDASARQEGPSKLAKNDGGDKAAATVGTSSSDSNTGLPKQN